MSPFPFQYYTIVSSLGNSTFNFVFFFALGFHKITIGSLLVFFCTNHTLLGLRSHLHIVVPYRPSHTPCTIQIQHGFQFVLSQAILALSHAFGQSWAKCPYSPQLKHLILDISKCPLPLESPLPCCFFFLLIFQFLTLILLCVQILHSSHNVL